MFDSAYLLLALLFIVVVAITETRLIVSCPDGKPTEEPPKGRGRGFGGMNSVQLELMCTNSSALCDGSYLKHSLIHSCSSVDVLLFSCPFLEFNLGLKFFC